MTDQHANPPRLKDRHDQPDLVERIAGQAARDQPEPPLLSASALARIAAHIEERASKPRSLRLGRVLVAASVLLGIVTVASAARMDLMPRWMAKMVGMEKKPAVEISTRPARSRSSTKKAEAPVAPVVPAPQPTPAKQEAQPEAAPTPTETVETSVAPVAPRPTDSPAPKNTVPRNKLAMTTNTERPGRGPGPGPGRTPAGHNQTPMFPSPPPPPSPAIQAQPPTPALASPSERPAPAQPAPAPPPPPPAPAASAPAGNPAARHLKEVVHALRVERAPRIALDLLDRHAHELAGNLFAEEALLLRVEAMLALRQQPEALHLLDGTSLANAASSSVLLVTRGQLRANANRCAEAVTDFDLVLARSLRPPKQALLGRAQCKQKLGDPKGAQDDLERLRREFP